jgi:hypothetical protein
LKRHELFSKEKINFPDYYENYLMIVCHILEDYYFYKEDRFQINGQKWSTKLIYVNSKIFKRKIEIEQANP